MATFLGAGQAAAAPAGGDPGVRVPGFWDPRRRPEKPDSSRISVIRFLTETDYPPFNFAGPDGNPQGFNVDLARLLCEELKVACTIQMRRFETLIAALNGNQGDADLLFGDAISLAFWLNGTDSENCCSFRGGPYIDSRYFGEGIGIAVKKGNDTMRLALNWALFRVWEQGRFTDLWLRYFPISPF